MADTHGKKILVAEDEAPLAKALDLKLSREGYTVVRTGNGEEAKAQMESAEEPFDLLILDLVMPKMNGFQVLEYLRDAGNTVPVIVLSNLSQGEDMEKAKELGAKEFFIKSNTPLAELVQQVHIVLSAE